MSAADNCGRREMPAVHFAACLPAWWTSRPPACPPGSPPACLPARPPAWRSVRCQAYLEPATGPHLRVLIPPPRPAHCCKRFDHAAPAAAAVQDVQNDELGAQQLHSICICSG